MKREKAEKEKKRMNSGGRKRKSCRGFEANFTTRNELMRPKNQSHRNFNQRHYNIKVKSS